MNTHFSNLRNSVEDLKRKLRVAEADLAHGEHGCRHDWSPVQPDHIYTEGYTIRGDRPGDPGYGGVDRQFDCYVPSKTEKRWKRTCKTCGKVEHTTRTTQEVKEHPSFD